MATASIWQKKFLHAFMGSFDNHCPPPPSKPHCYRFDQAVHSLLTTLPCYVFHMYSCAPWPTLLPQNPILSRVWHVFLRPLILAATTKPHGVTGFKYMFVPLNLIAASKFGCVSNLTCVFGLSQLNRCFKASPFSSSLTRSRRLRHKVSFGSTPTVRNSWCVWEIALIAECEWSR